MSIANFNAFDWILVVIVLVSMGMSFRRGLVRAIFGLLGLIGGFLLASWNYETVGDWVMLCRFSMRITTARIIAFLLIVAISAVAFEVIGVFLQKLLRSMGLGWFDRLLGMAFGFARGCLISIGLLMAASTFLPQSEFLTTSALTPYLFAVAHDVSFLVPQYLQQLMVSGAVDFKHGSPHWINGH